MTAYGALVSLPIEVPSAKNSTEVTVFCASAAEAVTSTGWFGSSCSLPGAVIATVGLVVGEEPWPIASMKFSFRSPVPGSTTYRSNVSPGSVTSTTTSAYPVPVSATSPVPTSGPSAAPRRSSMVPAVRAETRSASWLTRCRLTGLYIAQAPSWPASTVPPPSTSRLGAVVIEVDLRSKNSACLTFGKTRVVFEPVSGFAPPSPPLSV